MNISKILFLGIYLLLLVLLVLVLDAAINNTENTPKHSQKDEPMHVANCSLLYMMYGDRETARTIMLLYPRKDEALIHLEDGGELVVRIKDRPELLQRAIRSYEASCNLIGEKLPENKITNEFKNL
jgi:hypothetical protein